MRLPGPSESCHPITATMAAMLAISTTMTRARIHMVVTVANSHTPPTVVRSTATTTMISVGSPSSSALGGFGP